MDGPGMPPSPAGRNPPLLAAVRWQPADAAPAAVSRLAGGAAARRRYGQPDPAHRCRRLTAIGCGGRGTDARTGRAAPCCQGGRGAKRNARTPSWRSDHRRRCRWPARIAAHGAAAAPSLGR